MEKTYNQKVKMGRKRRYQSKTQLLWSSRGVNECVWPKEGKLDRMGKRIRWKSQGKICGLVWGWDGTRKPCKKEVKNSHRGRKHERSTDRKKFDEWKCVDRWLQTAEQRIQKQREKEEPGIQGSERKRKTMRFSGREKKMDSTRMKGIQQGKNRGKFEIRSEGRDKSEIDWTGIENSAKKPKMNRAKICIKSSEPRVKSARQKGERESEKGKETEREGWEKLKNNCKERQHRTGRVCGKGGVLSVGKR